MLRSTVDPLDQLGEVALLDRVGAGRRLVEQQDTGVGAERAGDLQPALLAVRQRAGQLVGPLGQADLVEQRVGLAAMLSRCSLRCQGSPEHGGDRPGLLPGLDRRPDVLQGRQGREQPDVLEGTGHARGG